MSQWTPSSKIAVRDAGARGRGVFALRDLAEGELVEEVLVIPLSAAEAAGARERGGVLEDYLFAWDLEDESWAYAVATGCAPLYNHSATPNVSLARDFSAKVLRFFALRPVRAGEELCFDYDCPLWFEPA